MSTTLTRADVARIAELARLELTPEELDLFGRDAKTLLSVRPGIFGAWTSLGRRRPPYPERARIEVEWVRRRSARGDALILLRSVGVVLRGQREG